MTHLKILINSQNSFIPLKFRILIIPIFEAKFEANKISIMTFPKKYKACIF